jgi:hypothetical protein
VTVALCVHGAAFAASDRPAPTKAWSGPPLEVELEAPAHPAPPPPAALHPGNEEEEAMDPVHVGRPPSKVTPRPGATPPALARAAKVGALLTSGEAAESDDPVAFLSDPNGGVYGSGVVAQGGQIEHGAGPLLGASVPVAEPSREKVEAVVPIANLGRAPSLDEPDACRGFFPAEAAVDGANVDLVVVVQAEGRVISATIARESPEGEGFGRAARACLLSKRFTPGADRAGRPVTASTGVRVFFTR